MNHYVCRIYISILPSLSITNSNSSGGKMNKYTNDK